MRGFNNKNSGLGLAEVIIAVALILLTAIVLFAAYTFYLNVTLANTKKIQGAFLAEEAIEAVKTLRDANWTNISGLTSGTTYYLNFNGTSWQSSATPNAYVDGVFKRSFSVATVYRNSSTQDISASGTTDPNTKKVTADVSWRGLNGTSTLSISTYLTNIAQ